MKAELRVLHAEPIGAEIVSILTDTLRQAKAGELSSLALAWVHRDGATNYTFSESPNAGLLIGSIARLQHALIDQIND